MSTFNLNKYEPTHTHTHSKKQLYRWIGLIIGLILGLICSFFFYKWMKKEAAVHFQKNIGEEKFLKEKQKWDIKHPLQAREIALKIWKRMGIYEELKNETNPEIMLQKVTVKREVMSKEER